MLKRVGFACKLSEIHPKKGVISIPEYNTQTTTAAWMSRQSRDVAEERLWEIIKHNIEATRKLVEKVGNWNEQIRMVRLSSDICPLWTHANWRYFYRQADVVRYMERYFREVGEAAKVHNVRISFHPGQFCCVVSENEGIVENSLAELEYHADMMRFMGYGNSLLDAKINIHLSGKKSVAGFESAWSRMSPELRNMLTLENDEFQAGLDTVLQLKNKVGIVLDLHHHWIATGEYINANDPRIKMVIDSWCRDGTERRPAIHYSLSREEYLANHSSDVRPARDTLVNFGIKKAKLREHSDMMWNTAVNTWAKEHWEWADVMVESKNKNLASTELFKQWNVL